MALRKFGMHGQGEYCLRYGAVGTRVALVASEPITRQAGDWVAVPRNTALIIISEKVGNRLKCMPYPIHFVEHHPLLRCVEMHPSYQFASFSQTFRQGFECPARML